MSGKFISFEGPDGAGKTSVMRQIKADLEEQFGADRVMYTREPGGNHISEQIRRVLFNADNTDMDARTEALLFAAARRQHIVSEILPALQEDKVILCDRYVDSSIAYQGAGRHLGEQEIWQLNQFAIDGLLPELTVYLDVPSEVGLRRIAEHRSDQVNRLDKEKLAFHHLVRHSFLRLQQAHPDRIKLVDASQPLAKVVADVKQVINARYPELFN
ncbi:dTMP kinase [Limosilactobacillus pontis]|uniref:Thymidylate kinase n=1 Tax=Limosilactobacillus pontis TaxID=35787 RepID=A0ABT7UWI5_9LACO|nr:dTMP kinase [Limosilactobacillus pontis]MDM8266070.1 dTMP kinase [Limosilactobacillus pontis]MDM8331319.1 dTMP kinase [Limosilactobacillus pontis]HJA75184.1 dTMP kinase [Candidatus Limosilactobacillus gallistercoris]